MVDQIFVDYVELSQAIYKIGVLQKGTGYKVYCTSEFLNHSMGVMFQETNALYAKLMEIENTLIEIIKNTQDALTNAGVDFESAERTLINHYKGIVADMQEAARKAENDRKYRSECTVPLYGQHTHYTCGSASGSMILNSLGVSISEETFWNYANSGGKGTYVYRVTQTLNHFLGENKYSYVQTGSMSTEEYYNVIKKSLSNGYPVQVVAKVPSGTVFGYSTNGHYVVVTGVYRNDAGEYVAKVNDPYSKKGPNNPQKFEIKLSELKEYNAKHSGYIICNK